MIVFSALTPHPPILIPEIGKENLEFIKNTYQSMETLGQDLYAAKPDTIIIISPHGPLLADAFNLNMANEFTVNFHEFGDLKTEIKFPADIRLIHHYKEILEAKMPVVLTHQPELDHGTGVPLYFLSKGMESQKPKIVPLTYSLLDYKTHFKFGKSLQEDIINDTKRLAIIASGDLSHRLTEDAPAGYSHWAKKFDETLIDKILKKDTQGILNLDSEFIEEAGECGLRSIIILLGMLNSINYQPELYSYEGPFGVGYAVINFKIKR